MKFDFSEFSSKVKLPVILRRWQFFSPEILTTLRWQVVTLLLSIWKTTILYFIYYQRAFSQKWNKKQKKKINLLLLSLICSGEFLSPFSQINSQDRTDRGFPRGDVNLFFDKIFTKNCMKMKEIGHTPPRLLDRPVLIDIEFDSALNENKLTWTSRKFCMCYCART